MFKAITDIFFWLITKISSLIMTPIITLLNQFFPDLTDIISNVQSFLTTYVFNTLQWFKMLCINVLCFPIPLYDFLVSCLTLLITLHTGMLIYRGVIKLYNTFKP